MKAQSPAQTTKAVALGLMGAAVLLLGAAPANVDYPYYGGDAGGSRYSPLTQITPANVARLKETWRYDLGGPATIQNQPLIVGRTLFGVSLTKVYALDAATGAMKWEHTFRPLVGRNPRGTTYWTDGKERRLLIAYGGVVLALNADTGAVITSFGKNGEVDLNDQLRGPPSENQVRMTSPVAIHKDVFVTGGGVGERTPASPGDIRGWDVRTGKLLWTFHTIPHPGEYGYETWPKDAYLKAGGANNWAGMAVDDKRGIVYATTGSPSDDFYGGERLGDNLFGNSIIALDAQTGKRLWHYQVVHHDLWDADFAAPPSLTTITRNGKKVDVVVATNKSSYIWVLDRVTGKPVFQVDEKPVPPTTVEGDVASRTQPVPQAPPPLSRIAITEKDLTTRTPEAHAFALEKFKTLLNGPQYTPPAFNHETIVGPGFSGGLEWGGITIDPRSGVAFFNTANRVSHTAVVNHPPPVPGRPPVKLNSKYNFSGYHGFVDNEGYAATEPPWGHLTAVDLNTGKFLWRIPFGEIPALVAKGVRNTGSANVGAGVVTASNLLLIGATSLDSKFHAFDIKTGKLLWETTLPAPGTASTVTYMIDGKQYVAITTSGARGGGGDDAGEGGPGGAAPARRTSSLVVFALPQ